MPNRKRSVAAAIWVGVTAAVVVSVLLAPVVTGGWCADAPVGGTSVCGSFERSLVGIDTNVWIWLGAITIVAVVTIVIAHRRRKLSQ